MTYSWRIPSLPFRADPFPAHPTTDHWRNHVNTSILCRRVSRKTQAATTSPRLETLEDRAVPSASPTLDLTTRGSRGEIGDALFRQTDAQPTGTGFIRSFVRLQAGAKASVEQGYNTDARPLQFDENKSPQFTRALSLTNV